ncbi:uncharacterized protein LOC118204912 [Stegodyphus dumicola]|uniref:uncharacterized protein LOC118204912 n=1 Tax=Stegodyphus dumicola TaxID=202533 RepID=UPI0015AF1B1A|nr:uncharacterized protein LOC118204912 [Stegodyphus dumicola]
MPSNEKLSYHKALRNLMKTSFHKHRLSSAGVDIMSKILNKIHVDLIKGFEDEFGSSDEITNSEFLHYMHKAAEKMLIGDIRKHALSEAQRQLTLLKNGLLQLPSKKSVSRKARKDVTRKLLPKSIEKIAGAKRRSVTKDIRMSAFILRSTFKRLLFELSGRQQVQVSCDSQCSKCLENTIFIIIEYLISCVSDICQAGKMPEITHLEFYDVINDTFPHALMQHALAEGSRYVKEYADGLLNFVPKKPVPKQVTKTIPFKSTRKVSTRQKPIKEKPKLNKVQMPTFMLRSTFKELLPEYNDRKQSHVICDSKSLKYMEHIIFAILDDICYHVTESCRTGSMQNMGHLELSEFIKNSFPNELKLHAIAEGSRYVKEYADGN